MKIRKLRMSTKKLKTDNTLELTEKVEVKGKEKEQIRNEEIIINYIGNFHNIQLQSKRKSNTNGKGTY